MDGGAGDDVYIFDADVALGSDTVIENSSKGIDLLDFSLTTTRNIVLSLSVSGPQVVNDRLTLTIGGNQEFENITGGSLHDHLTGNSLVNVLTGGAGDDNLEGLESGDSLIGGAGNDTLAGGGGDDKYLFDADSALGSDVLVEQATALGGVDLLDFSATTGVGITLDLASTGPQVLNARHTLTLSSGAAFEIVLGTALADTIHGNSLNNALFGGRGNDTLRGFGGRDLIVAGSGIDSLYGGDDEDLLIAGLLSYYNESTGALDRTALDWIMAEWTRLDADYQLRMSHLRVGGGLNGIARLTASTVPSETTYIDTLFGEAGLDWFWGYNKDVFADLGTGGPEVVN
jgi:Ca2+-binding RTX toxin-like protein